jgi:hypothetical protein
MAFILACFSVCFRGNHIRLYQIEAALVLFQNDDNNVSIQQTTETKSERHLLEYFATESTEEHGRTRKNKGLRSNISVFFRGFRG